jgi:hypothetical protein
MGGGIQGFAPGIDLMFWIHRREQIEHLGIAAVVHRTTMRRQIQAHPSYYTAPPGATEGGGSGAGPFYLSFYLPQRVFRIDGTDVLTMPPDHNVVLLVEEERQLRIVATHAVTSSLGSNIVRDTNRLSNFVELIRERLHESPETRAFLARS